MGEEKKDGSGLSKLRITKKAYVFDVKKKYSLSKNFIVKKEAQTPAEEIKQKIASLISKKEAKGEKKEGNEAEKKAAPSAPFVLSPALAAIIVILLILLGSFAFILWSIGSYADSPSAPQPALSFGGKYAYEVRQSDLLTSPTGEDFNRIAYYRLTYSASNISSIKFKARMYAQQPTTQAFLLDYAREGADSYPVFRKKLLEALKERGIPISEITVEKLAHLPGGATVVVPTGYFPKELLGKGSSFDFEDLLERGNNIIYIGFPIDRALGKDGLTEPVSIKNVQFTKSKLISTDGFRLFDAQYSAAGSENLYSAGQIYGSVSVIKSAKGGGALIILPQSLDGGWRGDQRLSGGQVAALDIARLIEEQRWLQPIAIAEANTTISEDVKSGAVELYSAPFSANKAYVELSAEATDVNEKTARKTEFFEIEKVPKGEIQPREPIAVPYSLSGQLTRLNIKLQEDSPTPVKLFVRLYKNGSLMQEEELEIGLTNPTIEKPKDIQVNVAPGTYIVRVESREGKVYAQTFIQVVELDIRLQSASWQNRTFVFSFSAGGQSINPRSIEVSMDGKNWKRFTSSQYLFSDGATQIVYNYPESIAPGNHTFHFVIGSWSSYITQEYRQQRYPWDNPLVIILGLVSLGIFALGLYLRRPEVLRYGLDIPDFPPMSTIKIPIKREAVLQIFNDVNASYSWQYMPLRPEEIKNGFRRLTYNGKPILIGDFNLDRILSKLKDEGRVKEELGYYGLVEWERQSKHTTKYLTIYRILRNVFVNNAVRFSKLDALPECDVKAIAGKDELYFHIMEEPFIGKDQTNSNGAVSRGAENVVHRALSTAKKGTTIIVFRTEEERDSFMESLAAPSKLAVALKMEINNGNIHLLPVKNAISAFLKGMVK
ncbi:MAG: hypothetical protein QW275_00245 [Candidatus Anstonellaceae archaeon]